MIDALKSVRDISRICEVEMRDSNHMRDITHLYPIWIKTIKIYSKKYVKHVPITFHLLYIAKNSLFTCPVLSSGCCSMFWALGRLCPSCPPAAATDSPWVGYSYNRPCAFHKGRDWPSETLWSLLFLHRCRRLWSSALWPSSVPLGFPWRVLLPVGVGG